MISTKLSDRKLFRVGPVRELIIKGDGSVLDAQWEPASNPADDTFRKCRINGRFVTCEVYKQHRSRINGRS